VLDATESYFSDQDLMAHWIEECCRTGVDAVGKQLRTRHADLFHSWTKFAEVNGERSGSAKAFTDALRRRGFDSVRKIGNESVRGFQGIALKNETLGDG
jgi:putative DNA primase/helicase